MTFGSYGVMVGKVELASYGIVRLSLFWQRYFGGACTDS